MKVEMWADVMCPWCYLGHLRLRSALARFAHADEVRTVWRSFELRPEQPRLPGAELGQMMQTNHGLDAGRLAELFGRIEGLVRQEGGRAVMTGLRPVNSFDAHRLIHLADSEGLAAETVDRLFRAYFAEHENVADRGVLLAVAEEVGLPSDRATAVLTGVEYGQDVRDDERRAAEAGVTSVPTFFADGSPVAVGASSADDLVAALEQAWQAGALSGRGGAGS